MPLLRGLITTSLISGDLQRASAIAGRLLINRDGFCASLYEEKLRARGKRGAPTADIKKMKKNNGCACEMMIQLALGHL